MAGNDYTPTAANILSSLNVKGYSITGGSGKDRVLPVTADNGKLDISIIPTEDILAAIQIPPLTKTAYVDQFAGSGIPGYVPNGSIMSPYTSLDQAASAGFSNFILVSGVYGISNPIFTTTESIIRIFSTGTASFDNLSIQGYVASGTTFILNNISVGNLYFNNSSASCNALLTGNGSVTTVRGALSDPDDPDVATRLLQNLSIGPCFTVTTIQNAQTVAYLASSSRIVNSSTEVPGTTVSDATTGLGRRRIRIPVFSSDENGIHAKSEDTVDIPVTAGSDYYYYVVTQIGTSLEQAANATFYKEGDSPEFSDVTSITVTAQDIATDDLKTERIELSDRIITIDANGFLSVTDQESSDSSESS